MDKKEQPEKFVYEPGVVERWTKNDEPVGFFYGSNFSHDLDMNEIPGLIRKSMEEEILPRFAPLDSGDIIIKWGEKETSRALNVVIESFPLNIMNPLWMEQTGLGLFPHDAPGIFQHTTTARFFLNEIRRLTDSYRSLEDPKNPHNSTKLVWNENFAARVSFALSLEEKHQEALARKALFPGNLPLAYAPYVKFKRFYRFSHEWKACLYREKYLDAQKRFSVVNLQGDFMRKLDMYRGWYIRDLRTDEIVERPIILV